MNKEQQTLVFSLVLKTPDDSQDSLQRFLNEFKHLASHRLDDHATSFILHCYPKSNKLYIDRTVGGIQSNIFVCLDPKKSNTNQSVITTINYALVTTAKINLTANLTDNVLSFEIIDDEKKIALIEKISKLN